MFPNSIRFIALVTIIWSSLAEGIVYFSTKEGCYSQLEGWTLAGTDSTYTPGTCGQQCQDAGTPLFALSGSNCYCGSALPPSSVSSDSSSCDTACQYYQDNICGEQGVYVVYLLQGESATTAAASLYGVSSSTSAAASSSTAASSSYTLSSSTAESTTDAQSSTLETSVATSTQANSTSSIESRTSSTTATSSSEVSSSFTSSSSTQSASTTSTAAQSSASPTASASASSTAAADASGHSKNKSGGISGGAIAGIVVGVVCGVLVVVAAIVGFILWRRKHNAQSVYSPENSPDNFKNDFGSFHDPYPVPPRPLMDPRLNPAMLGDPRISIASLADARDYSRQVLTVTNPDEKT